MARVWYLKILCKCESKKKLNPSYRQVDFSKTFDNQREFLSSKPFSILINSKTIYNAISHQYLTNVQPCYRQFGCQTIHPTQKFTSMNLLQINDNIKKNQSPFSEKNEAIFSFKYQTFRVRVNHTITHNQRNQTQLHKVNHFDSCFV